MSNVQDTKSGNTPEPREQVKERTRQTKNLEILPNAQVQYNYTPKWSTNQQTSTEKKLKYTNVRTNDNPNMKRIRHGGGAGIPKQTQSLMWYIYQSDLA